MTRRSRPWTALVALVLGALAFGCAVPVLPGSRALAAAAPEPCPDLQALVAAERAFARGAHETNVRDAFLAWLAGDAVVFRPRPVLARPVYEAMPEVPGELAWEPVFAAVARSGDAGYTTGPWSFRPQPDTPIVAWGEYVTIWRHQPEGGWRAIADIGVSHPEPAIPPPELAYPGDGRFPAPPVAAPLAPAATDAPGAAAPAVSAPLGAPTAPDSAAAAFRRQVRAAERAFGDLAAAQGAAAAYAAHADPQVRLYRDGRPPFLGREAALTAVASESGPLASRPLAVGAASSGDLGWAWGEGERGAARAAAAGAESPGAAAVGAVGAAASAAGAPLSWLRIWRRGEDGVWRMVVDVTLPVLADKDRGGS